MARQAAVIAAPATSTRILVALTAARMGTSVNDLPILDRSAVAELLGVAPKTISQFLVESKPGGRYSEHPFPTPDGRIGRGPYWLAARRQDIVEWDESRPGRGVRPQREV